MADVVSEASLPVADAASGRLRVVEWQDDDQWNAYACTQAARPLFYRAEWDRVFAGYKLRSIRLAAIRNDDIVGLLMLVRQSGALFGSQLVSLPWLDAAGILADDDAVTSTLLAEACRCARLQNVAKIQLRQLEPVDHSSPARTDKVLMRLRLKGAPDAQWATFSPKVRNQVRKAQKSGLVVESGQADLLADFFDIYARNMRDLGSPSHGQRFFARILETFGDESQIHVVRLNEKTVGAGLTMRNGDALEIPWASSLRQHNSLCVNHLLYWSIIRQACLDNFAWFHFGRSSFDSGTFRFKRQWGAEPVQLYWYGFGADTKPHAVDRPPQESYGWGVWAWRRLPVWLTRRLGPRLISGIA